MAIRRSGMFEAPGQIASITNPGNAVADTSTVWRALGSAMGDIQRRLQPAADQFARAQAEQDFAAGDIHRRTILVAEDEAYNNAMEQLYAVQNSMEIDNIVDRLENEHPIDQDVQIFDEAVTKARSAFVAGVNEDFAMQAGALFDRAHLSAREGVGTRLREFATQQLQQSGVARLAQMEMQLSGFTDLNTDEFNSRWREYDATGAALASNPLSGVFEDEWALRREHTLSRLYANSLQYTAEAMYDDGGANAESAEAAISFLEQSVARGTFQIGDEEHALTLTEGEHDAFFGEGRRRILTRERERMSAIRQAAAEMRSYRGELREEARDTFAEFNARTQAFSIIPDEEMANLRGIVEGSGSAALARQYNELVIENQYRRNVQGLSITQVEMANDRLQSIVTEGGEGAGEAAIALRAGRAYVEHLRRGDPLTVAQQHFGDSPPQIITDQGGFDVSQIGPRIRFSENAANELGSEQPTYFTPGEREAISSAVRSGGEEGLAAVRAIVGAAFTEDGDGFVRAQRMIGEVATRGDDALMAAGTTLLIGGESSSGTARQIMEAQRLRQTDGYVRPTLPGQNEGDTRERLIASYVGNSVTQPQMRAQLRRTADLVFEGMVSQGGEPNNTTYQAAIRASLGSVMRADENGTQRRYGGVALLRNDERVVIPNWIRNDQFANIRESLTMDEYIAGSGDREAPHPNAELYDLRRARLEPADAPGRYYLLDESGARIPGAPGVAYVLDFNRLRWWLAERRPDAVVR